MDVFVEAGTKRAFASAVDWPGWARAGRDEATALEALFAYASRYSRALRGTRLGFDPPSSPSELVVVERHEGTATTDFGVPDLPAPVDARPIDAADLKRLASLLRASWRALDRAAGSASGTTLRTGPRGGGRSLDAIVEHVVDAERGYLGRLGRKAPAGADLAATRAVVLQALASVAVHGVEERGPRGGKRWSARYFVRRTAWHALDHAWEIEDRAGRTGLG